MLLQIAFQEGDRDGKQQSEKQTENGYRSNNYCRNDSPVRDCRGGGVECLAVLSLQPFMTAHNEVVN